MAAPHNSNIKERILESATSLLRERSFNDVSLSEIAETAGVTKGSVYYYYKSKSDILYDIADGYLQTLYDDLIGLVENKDKDTSLPRLIRYALQRGVNDPGKNLRLHLTADAISGNEEIRGKLLQRYHTFRSIIGEKIAERSECSRGEDFEGWLIVTVVDGLMLQKLLGNSDIDIDRFIEDFVKDRTSDSTGSYQAGGDTTI